MNLLSQNPKTRNMALTAIATALALFGFAFIYINYFSSGASEIKNQPSVGNNSKVVSEQAVKKIEHDISAIENELKNDFYKSLRKHTWTSDTTAPGKSNPFSKN